MNRLMILGFLLVATTAHALGTLQLGEPKVEGNRITIPVLLGGDLGTGVSAMDFRFRYNPKAVQPVSVMPGATALDAQKRVMSNLTAPGEYSIVMMGFNQSSCGAGEAIEIVLQRLEHGGQDWGVGLAEATMSTVDGNVLESAVLPPQKGSAGEDESPESDEQTPPGQSPVRGSEQEVVADDAALGNVPDIVVDAVAGAPAANGASTAQAAQGLKRALEEAAATRAAISSPAMDSSDDVGSDGATEQSAGEQNATQVTSAAASGGERASISGPQACEVEAAKQVEKVEHQSPGVEKSAEQTGAGTKRMLAFGAVFALGLLAACVALGRKRLFS